MFQNNRLQRYANLLGLSPDQLDDFMRRYKGYLDNKGDITKNILINGLFILDAIRTESQVIEAKRLQFKTKNLLIIKYRDEIVELYQNGLGSTRIVKHLRLHHNIVISKSAIERFISSNGITRRR